MYEKALKTFCYHRVFSKIDKPDNRKRHFLKIKYINRSFLNISGILRNPEIKYINRSLHFLNISGILRNPEIKYINRSLHFLNISGILRNPEIKYINRSLDFLNIWGILRNPEIHKIVPSYSDNIETSILSYYYKDLVEEWF
jgi:hypothetical protein